MQVTSSRRFMAPRADDMPERYGARVRYGRASAAEPADLSIGRGPLLSGDRRRSADESICVGDRHLDLLRCGYLGLFRSSMVEWLGVRRDLTVVWLALWVRRRCGRRCRGTRGRLPTVARSVDRPRDAVVVARRSTRWMEPDRTVAPCGAVAGTGRSGRDVPTSGRSGGPRRSRLDAAW